MASVDFWLGVRQTLLAAAYAAGMIWVYHRILGVFDGRPVGWGRFAGQPCRRDARRIRFSGHPRRHGGFSGQCLEVYFSSTQFLNHAATNPVFSFLASLGDRVDYADDTLFFDEAVRAAKFDALRGNGPAAGPTEPVLNTARPNVVIVILESFARTVMDAEVGRGPVMPYMQRLKGEGIWFENFFANSFRTDRGEVAILSGFPAQTRIIDHETPGQEPQPAFDSPFAGGRRLCHELRLRRRPQFHESVLLHVRYRMAGVDLAEGPALRRPCGRLGL